MPIRPEDNPKPYKKGQSGNPAGKPKGTLNRSTIIKRWLEAAEDVQNPITGKNERLTQADIMTLALIKEARKGNVNAYKELMDSMFGTKPQTIIQEGEGASFTLKLS
jgi:hypothetical protein